MNASAAIVISLLIPFSVARAQQRRQSMPADAGRLAQTQLRDTAATRRLVARELLTQLSDSAKHIAARSYVNGLHDSAADVRGRAFEGLSALGSAALPAIPTLLALVQDTSSQMRASAISALGSIGPAASSASPTLRSAADQAGPPIRLRIATALMRLGDTTGGITIARDLLNTATGNLRLRAAQLLSLASDPAAVPVLIAALHDTSYAQRIAAAEALGWEGPKASDAVTALIPLLSDTVTHRRFESQAMYEYERVAPYAAWALSRILPITWGVGLHTALRLDVDGRNSSLRDDGLGVYAWGIDSVAVFEATGLFIHLGAGDVHVRGPVWPESHHLRRSLLFDLSKPVPGSGAKKLGVVRDNEAQLWVWYQRDSSTGRVTSFASIPVSDSAHNVERVEMRFRIDGVLHILQMGPFHEGQGGGDEWAKNGVTGVGTTMAQVVHPSDGTWVIRAPEGSIAHLWDVEDRAHAVDRGLYTFALNLRFMSFPSGADPCPILPIQACRD